MSSPLVSCIVPVFNGERYVSEALASIQNQTYCSLEIIVVDDGSTDNTKKVVTSLEFPIHYVEQANSGPAVARNHGISLAKGDFISFLDSDDLWHQEKLTKQMTQFYAKPDLEICITHVDPFKDLEFEGKDVLYHGQRPLYNVPGYVTGTLLTRRTTFEKIGCFDPTLRHGDANDWFIRAADRQLSMELIPEVLVYRRLHSTSFSSQGVLASLDEHLNTIKASLDRRRQTNGGAPQPYQFPISPLGDRVVDHEKK